MNSGWESNPPVRPGKTVLGCSARGALSIEHHGTSERDRGIEPRSRGWEPPVLLLDQSRTTIAIKAEGEGVEPSRLIARPISNRVPSPFGLPFRIFDCACAHRRDGSPPVIAVNQVSLIALTTGQCLASGRQGIRTLIPRRETALAVRPGQPYPATFPKVDRRGVEPRFPACKAGVVPLDQQPVLFSQRSARELNSVPLFTREECSQHTRGPLVSSQS
jgi:hypothetical protein